MFRVTVKLKYSSNMKSPIFINKNKPKNLKCTDMATLNQGDPQEIPNAGNTVTSYNVIYLIRL